MSNPKVDDLVEETINNIREDRATANKLLIDLIMFMAKEGDSAHASAGHIATSYLETLQRSNEQLVKITALLHKDAGPSKTLTKGDKDVIFDMIKEK
jgi:uncharacterized membrane protein